jgi:hypothetical protein
MRNIILSRQVIIRPTFTLRLHKQKPPWLGSGFMSEDADRSLPAEERLRRNLLELMAFRRMKQAELADLLGKTQSWVSKRLSEHGNRFQFEDLDALATIFGLSPWELLQPAYGKWDRRSGQERRSGGDRRRRARTPFHRTGMPQSGTDAKGVA